MLSFLRNQWVVGIGGGIVSGIIVYFITNWLYKRKDNSKYLEQIENANLDIIRTLKPYVAEKGLPSKEVIDAIIVSTARKHKVKSEELYSIRIICEELIREIIENAYVSSDKKQEFSQQLSEYLYQANAEQQRSVLISEIEKEIKLSHAIEKTNYQRQATTMLSIMMAVFASVLTILSVVLSITEPSLKLLDGEFKLPVIVACFVCLIEVIVSYIISIFLKLPKKQKKRDSMKQDTE
ncbi:MAG: hypothetical protein J6B70_10900 [Oscillospiraceae bacterium]|nr:hypothetical protein [Oscillospiraceae bacterium]